MGKKANSQQLQASKRSSKNHEIKPLHSLMKVLRPKVYITDRSSFKQLVQELTGNRSQLPDHGQQIHQNPVLEIEDQRDQTPAAAAAATVISMESSFSPSFELCDVVVDQAFQLEEMNQVNGLIMQTAADNDHMISTSDHVSLANQLSSADWNIWLAYQNNLESWLLDTDYQPYSSCYNGCSSSRGQNEQDQDVSLFDYELAGLIG